MTRFVKGLVFALFIGLGLYGFLNHALLPGIACLAAGVVAAVFSARHVGRRGRQAGRAAG